MTTQINLNNIIKDVIEHEANEGNLSNSIITKSAYENDLSVFWDILFNLNNCESYLVEKANIEQESETQLSNFINTLSLPESLSVISNVYNQISSELSSAFLSNYTPETLYLSISDALLNRNNYFITDADFEKLNILNSKRDFEDYLSPKDKKQFIKIKNKISSIGYAGYYNGYANSNNWRTEHDDILNGLKKIISNIEADIYNSKTLPVEESCKYAEQIQNYSSKIRNLCKDIINRLIRLNKHPLNTWTDIITRIGTLYGYIYDDRSYFLLSSKLDELSWKIFSMINDRNKVYESLKIPINENTNDIFADIEKKLINSKLPDELLTEVTEDDLGLNELKPPRNVNFPRIKINFVEALGVEILIMSVAGAELAHKAWWTIIITGGIHMYLMIALAAIFPISAGAEPLPQEYVIIPGQQYEVKTNYYDGYLSELISIYNQCVAIHERLHSGKYNVIEKVSHFCIRSQEEGCANEAAHMESGTWKNVYLYTDSEHMLYDEVPPEAEWDETLSAYVMFGESFDKNNTADGHGDPTYYPVDINVYE